MRAGRGIDTTLIIPLRLAGAPSPQSGQAPTQSANAVAMRDGVAKAANSMATTAANATATHLSSST